MVAATASKCKLFVYGCLSSAGLHLTLLANNQKQYATMSAIKTKKKQKKKQLFEYCCPFIVNIGFFSSTNCNKTCFPQQDNQQWSLEKLLQKQHKVTFIKSWRTMGGNSCVH